MQHRWHYAFRNSDDEGFGNGLHMTIRNHDKDIGAVR